MDETNVAWDKWKKTSVNRLNAELISSEFIEKVKEFFHKAKELAITFLAVLLKGGKAITDPVLAESEIAEVVNSSEEQRCTKASEPINTGRKANRGTQFN